MSVPISVVVPARNAAGTLVGTLESVHGQTVQPARVIVVDDGSTDATRDLAREYAPDVLVLSGAGRGRSAARNLGLRTATTRHVALIDADDRWEPWFLAEVERALERYPDATALFLTAAVVDDDGRRVGVHLMPDGLVTLEDLVLGRVVPTTSATVIDRHVVLELGGFYEALHGPEDLDLWFRLAERHQCYASSCVSAVYVVHDRRDRARSGDELRALERDRERVVSRLAVRAGDPRLVRRAAAIMRARTARYWLIAGRSRDARRVSRLSLRSRPTLEGLVTLAAACAPAVLRESVRRFRRRRRAGLVA